MNQVLFRLSQFVEANNQYEITTDKFWTHPIQYVQRSTLNSLILQTDDTIRCERQTTPEFNISLCTLDDHVSFNGLWSIRWFMLIKRNWTGFFFFTSCVSLSSRWLSHCMHCMPARNSHLKILGRNIYSHGDYLWYTCYLFSAFITQPYVTFLQYTYMQCFC